MSPGSVALAALLLLAVGVILVPALASHDPSRIDDVLARRLVPPLGRDAHGTMHLLGTDRFGRDLLVRMMLAGRLSLLVGVIGAGVGGLVGTLVGALAGWRRGVLDRALMALADLLLALPRIVLLLVGVALWSPGLKTILVVLVATGWMGVARLVRAEVIAVSARPFVAAATALGAAPRRVLFRHVVPNAIGPAFVATTLGVGNAILLESGLSFLGLGIQPPAPSWGNMIAGGRDLLVTAPWVALAPGIALVVTVLATSVVGDEWRDRTRGAVGLRGDRLL
ncbi:MAG: ABC transporter permease [Gemmatimonadota bacterium]|nr:ABC transporter permease [Gemmatimonadota bacterium]